MENFSVWLLIFAGGTIGLLGTFLFTSERELGKKRREIEYFRRQHAENAGGPAIESQPSEAQSELAAKNQQLIEQIASLTGRLEESQRMTKELEAERHRLLTARSENDELQKIVANLQSRLQASEARFSESATQNQGAADRQAKLQAEMVGLRQQLQASEAKLRELHAERQRLLDAEIEKQKLGSESQQMQQEIANLRNQIQRDHTKLETSASRYEELADRNAHLQCKFADLKQEADKLTKTNAELLGKIDSISNKLAASERRLEELQTLQERLKAADSDTEKSRAFEKQRLQDEVKTLRAELRASESRLGESVGRHQELLDRNAKMENEMAELKHTLQASQKTADELRSEQRELNSIQLENRRLQQDVANLQNQLQSSEARLSETSWQNQNAADRNTKLQSEIADLRQKLRESQEIIAELETERRRSKSVDAEKQELQEQIANLRDQLETSETRLNESARRNLEAADSLARLQVEAVGLKRQLEESQTKARELKTVKQQLADFESRETIFKAQQGMLEAQIAELQRELPPPQTKQTPWVDGNGSFQREISSGRELGGGALRASDALDSVANEIESPGFDGNSSVAGSVQNNEDHTSSISNGSGGEMSGMGQEKLEPPTKTSAEQKWRVRTVPAVIALAIAGSVGFWGGKLSSSKEEPAVVSETVSDDWSSPIDPASQTATKPEPRLQGTFKITRPTQIRSGPSADSSLIANVGPGMKINVVGSRDGWLEIRSKHGRPPGFVRQDAAVKSDQN